MIFNFLFCRVQSCLSMLEKQVELDFMRTMNKMTFDDVIRNNRKAYAYVTLPEKCDPFPKFTGLFIQLTKMLS